MEEETYDTGLWLLYNIEEKDIYFSNHDVPSNRISGVMNLKQFPGREPEQYINDFVPLEDVKIKRRTPFSPLFWSDSFYEIEEHESRLEWQANHLKKESYNSPFSKNLINKYNINYVLENNQKFIDEEDEENKFFSTMNNNRYKIYSNDKLSLWYL